MELHEIPGFEKAKFEILSTDRLFVDVYQRNVNPAFVNRISKRFSPVLIGCLICSARQDGKYAVVDGQHRFEIMKSKGLTHAPCITFPMAVIDEALAFIGANRDRNTMSATALFWANIEARDPVALKVRDITESAGFFITETLKGSGANPKEINAVGALNSIYTKYAKGILEETLLVLSQLWVNDPRRTRGNFLLSIAEYIRSAKTKEEYDRKKLIIALSKMDAATFQKNLGQYSIMFGSGKKQGAPAYAARFIRGLLGED